MHPYLEFEMTNHSFTLIVNGGDLHDAAIADALYEAGCDDALIGTADGIQYLDFDREADALEDAVLSAVADIEAVDGLEVVRLVDAGLISQAEIAQRTGRTPQSIQLLVTGARGPGGFPPPVNDPRHRYRLWRVHEVDQWFHDSFGTGLDTSLRDDHVRAALNAGLELRHLRARITDRDLNDLLVNL